MTKFNQPISVEQRVSGHADATTNYEGGLAFRVDPEMELYLRTCTCLFEDKFYTSGEQQLAELRAIIKQCPRAYVLQLAAYARQKMHLRSAPLVLLAEASVMQSQAREPKTDVRAYTPKIVQRADEPAELVAYWLANIGGGKKHNFPNALRLGLSDALANFNAYQLAKYNRNGAVKLRDVIQIVHPRPANEEQSALYKQTLDGTLPTPETWETAISGKGSTAASWNAIAPKMGTMALLRNLRNFEEKNAKDALTIAVARFTDREAVLESKQLPFRWYTASKHVQGQKIRDALHTALDLSLSLVEPWPGETVILSDNSGSMHSGLSLQGETQYIEVASLLSAMSVALCPDGYRVGVFGERFAWVNVSKRDSILTNMQRIANTDVGHSTDAWKAIAAMRQEKVRADRVVLFSDMQCYNSGNRHGWAFGLSQSLPAEWLRYKREVNPKARLYSVDLAGYGTAQFPQDQPDTVLLAGWSDQVLDFVRHYEAGRTAVDRIKAEW